MTIWQVLVLPIIASFIVGVILDEYRDIIPQVADKLARWSASRHYAPPTWAKVRAEEIAGYIDKCPSKLSKMMNALHFVAVALVTRKVYRCAPSISSEPLWSLTALAVPLDYEDGMWLSSRWQPRVHAVREAWCDLTNEVRDAAKEVGVGSRSWRRCIEELERITEDGRWTLMAEKFDVLGGIMQSTAIVTNTVGSQWSSVVLVHRSVPTDSTIAYYRAVVETARAEIKILVANFLRRTDDSLDSSDPR